MKTGKFHGDPLQDAFDRLDEPSDQLLAGPDLELTEHYLGQFGAAWDNPDLG